jgi:hypothetical protein
MSDDDRKYRHRGYRDDDRDRPSGDRPRDGGRPERPPGAPAGTRRMSSEGAKNPRMMGYREVARCARCAAPVDIEVLSLSKCGKCGQPVHACIQCVHFDPAATFECSQQIKARVSPKDAANDCQLFTLRTSVERETSSTQSPGSPTNASSPSTPSGAKKAFDDLFNF